MGNGWQVMDDGTIVEKAACVTGGSARDVKEPGLDSDLDSAFPEQSTHGQWQTATAGLLKL